MATCLHCTNELTGRTKVCDACKARVARPAKRAKAKPAKRPTRTTKKAPAKKTAAKKATLQQTPPGLGDRGAALWRSLDQTSGTAAGEIALEACRLADRLEDLDGIIAGKGVLDLMAFRLRQGWSDDTERHLHVEVSFQNVLAEARQQATTFKQLLAELGITTVPAAPPTEQPVNPLDELRKRREQKAGK